MTAEEILNRLKEGNERFSSDDLKGEKQEASRRSELTGGQTPDAIILSCADSRVVPELAFDMGLGELFVVRVAGNIANTSSLASMEYAVAHLGSKVIIVLGHENCGAVTAALNGGDNGHNLNHLVSHITPAIAASPKGAPVNDVVRKNVVLTAADLVSRSEIIRNAVEKGGLKIVPAYYNLGSGKVDFLSEL